MEGSQSESLKAHRTTLVTVLEVHLSDRLRLLLQRQASPLRTAVDKKKTQSEPLRSNYYTQMNPTAFPSCSGEVWGSPLAVIDCRPSSSSDPPTAGGLDRVSATRFFLGAGTPQSATNPFQAGTRSTRNRTPSQRFPLELRTDVTANNRSHC